MKAISTELNYRLMRKKGWSKEGENCTVLKKYRINLSMTSKKCVWLTRLLDDFLLMFCLALENMLSSIKTSLDVAEWPKQDLFLY